MKDKNKYILEVSRLEKSFNNLKILDDISLQIKKGEILAIIGPSGSGKSTFLRCLNHLETIDKGDVYIGGEPLVFIDNKGESQYVSDEKVRKLCQKTGMVFQSFNLFPHLTVLENIIEAPITVKKIDKKIAIDNAIKLLSKVGLENKINVYPNNLSGGQKQRVAIARALAMEPEIMLFDEPTSALDPELTGEVLLTMKALASEHMTMIIVTHEINFARDIAHNIAFMYEGKIISYENTKDFFQNINNTRIKSFLSKIL